MLDSDKAELVKRLVVDFAGSYVAQRELFDNLVCKTYNLEDLQLLNRPSFVETPLKLNWTILQHVKIIRFESDWAIPVYASSNEPEWDYGMQGILARANSWQKITLNGVDIDYTIVRSKKAALSVPKVSYEIPDGLELPDTFDAQFLHALSRQDSQLITQHLDIGQNSRLDEYQYEALDLRNVEEVRYSSIDASHSREDFSDMAERMPAIRRLDLDFDQSDEWTSVLSEFLSTLAKSSMSPKLEGLRIRLGDEEEEDITVQPDLSPLYSGRFFPKLHQLEFFSRINFCPSANKEHYRDSPPSDECCLRLVCRALQSFTAGSTAIGERTGLLVLRLCCSWEIRLDFVDGKVGRIHVDDMTPAQAARLNKRWNWRKCLGLASDGNLVEEQPLRRSSR